MKNKKKYCDFSHKRINEIKCNVFATNDMMPKYHEKQNKKHYCYFHHKKMNEINSKAIAMNNS